MRCGCSTPPKLTPTASIQNAARFLAAFVFRSGSGRTVRGLVQLHRAGAHSRRAEPFDLADVGRVAGMLIELA